MKDIIKEFKEKVNELKNAEINRETGESEIVEFGYKVWEPGTLYNIVDFGNIEKFLQKAISQTEKETRERVIREIEEKLPKEISISSIINGVDVGDISMNAWNNYREQVKSILNQLKS